MSITAQHVAPEEIMAFLDGELSASDAKAVSTHVEERAECANVTEQLRRTSQALSAWKVPPIPARVEESIAELAAKAASAAGIRKPKFFVRPIFWGGKQYAALSLGVVSVLMIVVAIGTPNLLRTRSMPQQMLSLQRQENQTFDQFYSASAEKKSRGVGSGVGGGMAHGVVGGVVGGVAGGAVGGINGSGTGSAAFQTDGPLKEQAFKSEVARAYKRLLDNKDRSPSALSPMIARTMSLSIMTRDFARSRESLDSILAHYQGYSAQMNVSTTENAPRNLQASLRIPAPALPAVINDLRSLGRVEREAQSGEDVTRQHTDLVARLKNSRDTEQRLRDILQRRTGKLSDVLEVEQEISRVRGEIEEMESEQKALEHRVDFATVELQLTEEYKAQLNPPAASVSTRIHNAFVGGYQNASETLLGILLFFAEDVPTLLIWLAILALPVVLIWRRYRRISAAA